MNKNTALLSCRFVRANWGGGLGEQDNIIHLPDLLLKEFHLLTGNTVLLKIGSQRRIVTVKGIPSGKQPEEPVFFVSPDLAGCCQAPTGLNFTLKYDMRVKTLAVGPLIGLFTARNVLPESEFGTQEAVLAALANFSAAIGGLVFIFCPEDINFDLNSVKGYIPSLEQDSLQNSWVPLVLPLPDVVYDRIPFRTIETDPEVTDVKSRLMAAPGLTYFNPIFLNKWETFSILRDIPEIASYLPPTRLVESFTDIREFLDLYGSVFLKPSSGSLGRRIIKAETIDNLQYQLTYRSRSKETVTLPAANFVDLLRLMGPIMGKRTYVVQRNLQLAKFEDCPFDIRVLMQKDMFGNWRRTKIYVRVAAPDSFLSNLSDGGRPVPIATVLRDVFDTDFLAKDGLGEDLRNAIKSLPPALEAGTGMIWGELGLDLGIDCSGQLWLIEINAKPFRALVSNNGSAQIIERSLKRPLEFAKYLAGFYKHSPTAQSLILL